MDEKKPEILQSRAESTMEAVEETIGAKSQRVKRLPTPESRERILA
jgi:hypothetical protein